MRILTMLALSIFLTSTAQAAIFLEVESPASLFKTVSSTCTIEETGKVTIEHKIGDITSKYNSKRLRINKSEIKKIIAAVALKNAATGSEENASLSLGSANYRAYQKVGGNIETISLDSSILSSDSDVNDLKQLIKLSCERYQLEF